MCGNSRIQTAIVSRFRRASATTRQQVATLLRTVATTLDAAASPPRNQCGRRHDAIAMARVVDLIAHEQGTLVQVDILPGTDDDYLDAVARSTAVAN